MPDSLEDVVRPNQSPAQSAGYKPPATTGKNPDKAVATFGEGGVPAVDPANLRNDQINDLRLWPAFGASFAGTEEVVLERNVSGSYQIDFTLSNIVVLNIGSTGIALTFAALPSLPSDQATTIWGQRGRAATCEIIFHWLSASPSRTVSLAGVRFTDGVAPEWAPGADSYDTVLVQKFSNGLLLGFQPGADQKVPT
jgi:hypothetical protein